MHGLFEKLFAFIKGPSRQDTDEAVADFAPAIAKDVLLQVSKSPALEHHMSEKPLVIVDNSLIDNRGHHLALASTLCRAAGDLGQAVTVYCHKDFDRKLLPSTAQVRPVFDISVYEVFARKLLDHDMSPEMADVLDQVAEDFPDGARILFHTADAFTFCAIDSWLLRRKARGDEEHAVAGFDIHVITPYEPKLMPGFAMKGPDLYQALLRMARWKGINTRLYFGSETARLAEYFRRAFSMRTIVQTLPAPQWALVPPENIPDPGPRLTLNFLGAAREEKGFLHLPALAREVASRPGLSEKVKFRIHKSAPIVGFSKVVAEAFEELEQYDFVETFEGALDLDDYAREMHSTDVVFLLYDRNNYFARGSGIVVEAMCSGKHMLCMRDTFMQRLRDHGLARFGQSASEWAACIEELASDISGLRAHGRAAGLHISKSHSPTVYLKRLEAREINDVHFSGLKSLDIWSKAPAFVHA